MAANQRRRSRQRDRILDFLKHTRSHPTAREIYDRLRSEMPRLSMGTVYRNLAVLADQGLVSRLDFGGAFDRFEANTVGHHHFICERCGSVTDLDLPTDAALTRSLSRACGLRASRHEIRLFGLCERCRRKTRG